jgi:hypothetical protein
MWAPGATTMPCRVCPVGPTPSARATLPQLVATALWTPSVHNQLLCLPSTHTRSYHTVQKIVQIEHSAPKCPYSRNLRLTNRPHVP